MPREQRSEIARDSAARRRGWGGGRGVELRDCPRWPEIARRGPRRGGWVGSEGAEVTSAVEGQLGAREPDLGAGRLSFSLCVLAHGVRGISTVAISNCHSPDPSLPAGVGRARGRRVCGGCAGCLWDRESECLCPPCVVHNIEGFLKEKETRGPGGFPLFSRMREENVVKLD